MSMDYWKVDKTHFDFLTRILSSSNCIPVDFTKYMIFWTNLQDSTYSSGFLGLLLTRLLNIETGTSSQTPIQKIVAQMKSLCEQYQMEKNSFELIPSQTTTKRNLSSFNTKDLSQKLIYPMNQKGRQTFQQNASQEYYRTSIIITAFFIGLLYDLEPIPILRDVCLLWKLNRSSLEKIADFPDLMEGSITGFVNYLGDLVTIISESRNLSTSLIRLVDICTTIPSYCGEINYPEKFALLPQEYYVGLIYPYLMKLTNNGSSVSTILDTILLFLTTSEEIPKTLGLLHLLQCLIRSRTLSKEQLIHSKKSVSKLFLLPRFYGKIVQNTINLLDKEIAFSGISNLEEFLRTQSPIYSNLHLLILDQANDEGINFRNLMKTHISKKLGYIQMEGQLLKSILLRNLEGDLTILNNLECYLEAEKIHDYFIKLLEIYQSYAQLKSSIRVNEKQEKNTINETILKQFKELFLNIKKTIEQQKQLKKTTSKEGKGGGVGSRFFSDQSWDSTTLIPQLSDVRLFTFPIETGVDLHQGEILDGHHLLHEPILDRLERALLQFVQAKLKLGTTKDIAQNRSDIKFIVTGGDLVLTRVISAFVILKKKHPILMHKVNFKFYILPTDPDNQLASYIATYDGWYQTNVFFRCKSIFMLQPAIFSLELSEEILKGSNENYTKSKKEGLRDVYNVVKNPKLRQSSLIRSKVKTTVFNFQLRSFLLQSKSTTSQQLNKNETNVNKNSNQNETQNTSQSQQNINKIETNQRSCPIKKFMENPTPGDLMYETISSYINHANQIQPFYLFMCECYFDKQSNIKDYSVPFIQFGSILCEKDSKNRFNLLDLKINFVQVNPQNLPFKKAPQRHGQYHSVVWKNIPNTGDKGSLPNPSRPCLNLYLVDEDVTKRAFKSKKEIRTKQLKVDSTLISPEYVSSLEIESENSFYMTLDYQKIGPLKRIKISTIKDKKENLYLPIATFLPFDN
ncbi:protein -related [Anaeramoeba flamelloides]|uniref:Protein -related n=1 Tax=Anaeramoeba flamelloides TaxID=1746091 RepID=A0ABQ8YZ69_9EUKA|nr:protein -related [Anaeramoeba flamelloides]